MLDYQDLSDEAKETLKNMVAFCIERGYCMGQDEGILVFEDVGVKEQKHPFRIQLEKFSGVEEE